MILLIAVVLVGALALLLQGHEDSRMPRSSPSESKVVLWRHDAADFESAIRIIGIGLGLAALSIFTIRRYLVQPEPPPWQHDDFEQRP